MIGAGITLPVLPFYVERLAQAEGGTRQAIVMHIALLTAAYPLAQLVFAPVWGRSSDRMGRRPLLLMGLAGYVIAQVLFGLATSLSLLYAARILGGILSSATLPVSAAYVADATTDAERGRGMAWLGTATSLGFVVGPALGGLLARRDLHLTEQYGRHLMIDGFSVPFFAAAALGLFSLAAALRWLPESLPGHAPRSGSAEPNPGTLWRDLGPLLGLAFVAQFALAMFEATFALHAQAVLNYGPAQMGAVFVTCGLVMAVFQIGASGLLGGRVSAMGQVGMGLALMGTSLAVVMVPSRMLPVLAVVGLLALGMALIAPNLSALISTRGGTRVGTALGAQNAANSLGQAGGPLVGGALFVWQMNVPYLLGGGVLVTLALVIGWKALIVRR